jgi:hypothetical protein
MAMENLKKKSRMMLVLEIAIYILIAGSLATLILIG